MYTIGTLLSLVNDENEFQVQDIEIGYDIIRGTYDNSAVNAEVLSMLDVIRVELGTYGYKRLDKGFELQRFPKGKAVPKEYIVIADIEGRYMK